MRPWLLLASLLASDLSPHGDGEWMGGNYSWGLRRRDPPLDGEMTPPGMELLQIQTEHRCTGIQSVHVAVQHKQKTSLSYWAYTVHVARGCNMSPQESTGIICGNHIPAPVVAVRARPDTPRALRVLSKITSITAGGESRQVAEDAVKDHPGSGFVGLLHHHHFKALLLEKSKSRAPANVVQMWKTLTKRYPASTAAIAPCCFKGRMTSKRQIARPRMRQKESTKRARGVGDLTRPGGRRPSQASAGRRDIFHAASLHTGSSSERASDTSQFKIKTSGVRILKKNELLTRGEESPLAKRAQGQRSSKVASSVYNEDGFDVDRLTSAQKAKSINGPMRDDNEGDFSGKEITKQAGLRRPEGESETEQTHTNAIGNGNQRRSASIPHARSTHERDNKDGDRKQLLAEAGEEVLITLFLADAERPTQTEAPSKGELLLKTEWGAVNMLTKEPGDPPPVTKILKGNFIIEAHDSKWTCMGEVSLEMHALDRAEWRAIKPAQSKATTAPTHIDGQTPTNSTPHETMNHAKQEENEPSGGSVTSSAPLLSAAQLEKTEHAAETTTAEIKETTQSAEKGSTEAGPGFLRRRTESGRPAAEKSLSGLRMREDFPAYTIRLHEATEDGGREVTNGPDARREGVQSDSQATAFTLAEPPQTIHKGATGELPKVSCMAEFPRKSCLDERKIADINKPLCGGLIHRTEAGWRHCVERFTGARPDTFSSSEPFEDRGGLKTARPSAQDHKALDDDDEYDHFYYFDGVLKRVQNYFSPHRKRQRREKRSPDNEGNRAERGDNLLGYIRHLALRNKLSHFK